MNKYFLFSILYDYFYNLPHEYKDLELAYFWIEDYFFSEECLGHHEGDMWMWFSAIHLEVMKYLYLCEKSSLENATMLQDQYKIPEYKCFSSEAIDHLNSYKILKSEFSKCFDKLPALKNIYDVLNLKEKKNKEIKRLNEIIEHIETSLREGRTDAILTAQNEISKAVKELNWGCRVSKISKWCTYLSLPVGIIEYYMSLPPISGISLASIGALSTFTNDFANERNNWLQVVR